VNRSSASQRGDVGGVAIGPPVKVAVPATSASAPCGDHARRGVAIDAAIDLEIDRAARCE
jgi:hypothetical protein